VGDRGVSISIDDCGKGHAAIGRLAQFPVSELKVDRPHIARMTSDPAELAIVSSIISFAHAHNLRVVAEGVETHEQEQQLAKLRCDEAQGFLYSAPLPAAEVTRLLGGNEQQERPM
jgi:EAL domain-containing protein (putative c-di-GMP-specific phosphodiesterase class I)